MYNDQDALAELERICGEKGIQAVRLTYPLEKSALYITDLKSIVVGSNCDEKQLKALKCIVKNS